ncbi:hypothetical protein TRFO_25123 [Tritrichomonas foetus]|uniref:Alpha-tubulin N-acetyltransferase n=1 Tax=Tritrichomonas foetus TaxID=1144522 RepID=A0A1J4KAV1_9EUKA|nr:hypothetical protein TRFO_25123 [Tritrichomonas foetus]|eukprot:OHT06814.1 hypothetical protein TRFO_25123 [Tritrichomonas foetus]
MEHPGIRRLNPDQNGIAMLTSRQCRKVQDDLMNLINKIGLASSRAQGLNHVITTFSSFSNSDCKMYILLDDEMKRVVGFVKVGVRNLFLWDKKGVQHERKGLCLLDFFTYPQCQRKGYGKKMIDSMLSDQRLEMAQIPIDRPSNLCLSFMAKHFGLRNPINQANNFVVFDEYFADDGKQHELPVALQFGLKRPRTNFVLPQTVQATQATTTIGTTTTQCVPIKKENQPSRANIGAPIPNVLKQICNTNANNPSSNIVPINSNNPSRRTHYNPITWSVHPGISQ